MKFRADQMTLALSFRFLKFSEYASRKFIMTNMIHWKINTEKCTELQSGRNEEWQQRRKEL